MQIQQTTVVLNRHARRLKEGPFARRVEQALERAFDRPAMVHPPSAAAARHVFAALRGGRVVVAGGDGAINLALNALGDRGVALGIIPSGTANDLARALAMPLRPEGAARAARGAARPIDVLTVNGRRFCTTGGLGLPSHVARAANRAKRAGRGVTWLRHHLYSLMAGAQIVGRRRLRQRVEIMWTCADTGAIDTLEVELYGLLVTNLGRVAGSLCLCAAEPDDGVFEICLLPARGRHRLMRLLLGLTRGRPTAPGRMPVIRARAASIRCARPLRFFGDGEQLAAGRRFELGLLPGALRVAGAGVR